MGSPPHFPQLNRLCGVVDSISQPSIALLRRVQVLEILQGGPRIHLQMELVHPYKWPETMVISPLLTGVMGYPRQSVTTRISLSFRWLGFQHLAMEFCISQKPPNTIHGSCNSSWKIKVFFKIQSGSLNRWHIHAYNPPIGSIYHLYTIEIGFLVFFYPSIDSPPQKKVRETGSGGAAKSLIRTKVLKEASCELPPVAGLNTHG